MAKTKFQKAFDELKKVIVKTNTKGFGDFAFQFVIEGEGEGTFYVKCENEKLSVEAYDYKDNNGTFKATAETFKKLVAGDIAPDAAIADGSLVVEGNEAGAADIFNAISGKVPAPKKATKKVAAPKATKAPAKKATAAKKPAAKAPAAKKPATAKKTATAKKATAPKAETKKATAPKAETKPATAPKAEAPKADTTKKTTK